MLKKVKLKQDKRNESKTIASCERKVILQNIKGKKRNTIECQVILQNIKGEESNTVVC